MKPEKVTVKFKRHAKAAWESWPPNGEVPTLATLKLLHKEVRNSLLGNNKETCFSGQWLYAFDIEGIEWNCVEGFTVIPSKFTGVSND